MESHRPRGNLPSPKINNPQGRPLFTFVYAARADAEAGRDPVDKALANAVEVVVTVPGSQRGEERGHLDAAILSARPGIQPWPVDAATPINYIAGLAEGGCHVGNHFIGQCAFLRA